MSTERLIAQNMTYMQRKTLRRVHRGRHASDNLLGDSLIRRLIVRRQGTVELNQKGWAVLMELNDLAEES